MSFKTIYSINYELHRFSVVKIFIVKSEKNGMNERKNKMRFFLLVPSFLTTSGHNGRVETQPGVIIL
jgi:hypothetical protein